MGGEKQGVQNDYEKVVKVGPICTYTRQRYLLKCKGRSEHQGSRPPALGLQLRPAVPEPWAQPQAAGSAFTWLSKAPVTTEKLLSAM